MRLFDQYWWLFIGCLMLLPVRTMARQEPPSFANHYAEHYGDEHGLPSNDVTGFGEDREGYYWFATQFGLVRFDGRHFTHFYTGNVPAMSSNRIYALGSDAANNLLFCDEAKGVYQIQQDGRIQAVPGALAGSNFLMGRQGHILDMRKYLRDPVDSVGIIQSLQAYRRYELVPQFYLDANGNAWFMRIHDISYFKDGSFNSISNYSGDKDQHFYCNNALFVVNAIGLVQPYKEGKKMGLPFSMQSLLLPFFGKSPFDPSQACFSSNRTGTFLQYRNKLFSIHVDGQTVRLLQLLHHLYLPLAREVYYSVRHRIYIVRTSTHGFYLVREQPFTVRGFKEGMENSFLATLEIQPGQVFTSNGVLFSKDTARRVYDYNLQVFNTMLKDRDQQIWFMGGDTLFCMNNKLQEQKRWVLNDIYLKSLQQDDKGTIWYCTRNGLARIDSGRMQVLYADNTALDRSQCLFFLNDTTIWIGTTVGLFAYNKKNNTLKPIPEMAKNYVRHIYRAKDSSIWISTYGQGFYTWRNGRFIALPLDRDHSLAAAHCFMEDDHGFFWIPTNKGLFQVAKAALEAWLGNNGLQVYYHYYDKDDGFGTNEFNGGSSPVGIRLQDGTFSLPSMNGLVWFHPRQVLPALPMGKIGIDRVTIDSQQVASSGLLQFRAGVRKISFQISSPFFGNRNNFCFEYRIAGVDKLWIPVPDDNTININYLPPGKYALDIRLRSGFGVHDYTNITVAFSITPHFYETTAFTILVWLLLLLLITAGGYSFFRRRAQKAKERERYLEAQIQQRTQEQAITMQQLAHTVAELERSEENLFQANLLKDKLAAVILHNIRSPLRFMNMLSSHLHSSLTATEDQRLTALTAELTRSSDQLDFSTREFQLWLSVQQPGFRIYKEYVLIQDLFREAEEYFKNLLNYNNNNLHIIMGEDIRTWTDRQLLKIILYNLIDNANKRTENGTIGLMAYGSDDRLMISVSDSGREMTFHELQTLQGLLPMEDQLSETQSIDTLGYSIVPDLVRGLNGRIEVKYVLNTGTTVSLILPEQ